MAVLEQEGYLRQPYTSAGPVPTKAYTSTSTRSPSPCAGRRGHPPGAGLLRQRPRRAGCCSTRPACVALASYTAVVTASTPEVARVRCMQLVALSTVRSWPSRSSRTEPSRTSRSNGMRSSPTWWSPARPRSSRCGVGSRWPRSTRSPCPAATAATTRRPCRSAGPAGASQPGGQPRRAPLRQPRGVRASALDAIEVVRAVLQTLKQARRRLAPPRRARPRGHRGHRHRARRRAARRVLGRGGASSSKARPWRRRPPRPDTMNYPQALAAVDVVSHRLGERLSTGRAGTNGQSDVRTAAAVASSPPWPRTTTRCSVSVRMPRPRRSTAPTGAAPANPPDANPGDPHAEEQFKASRAPTRSSPTRSSGPSTTATARLGCPVPPAEGTSSAVPGPAAGDLFDAFFGGGSPFGGGHPDRSAAHGQDLEVEADLTFEQAVFGPPFRSPSRPRCAARRATATGRRPAPPGHLRRCAGAGQIRRVRQSMLGQMMTTSACPRCGGFGQVVVTPWTRAPVTAG